MRCMKCDRSMERCICEDAEARIESLRDSPYIAIDIDLLKARRLLNQFEIERDRLSIKPA